MSKVTNVVGKTIMADRVIQLSRQRKADSLSAIEVKLQSLLNKTDLTGRQQSFKKDYSIVVTGSFYTDRYTKNNISHGTKASLTINIYKNGTLVDDTDELITGGKLCIYSDSTNFTSIIDATYSSAKCLEIEISQMNSSSNQFLVSFDSNKVGTTTLATMFTIEIAEHKEFCFSELSREDEVKSDNTLAWSDTYDISSLPEGSYLWQRVSKDFNFTNNEYEFWTYYKKTTYYDSVTGEYDSEAEWIQGISKTKIISYDSTKSTFIRNKRASDSAVDTLTFSAIFDGYDSAEYTILGWSFENFAPSSVEATYGYYYEGQDSITINIPYNNNVDYIKVFFWYSVSGSTVLNSHSWHLIVEDKTLSAIYLGTFSTAPTTAPNGEKLLKGDSYILIENTKLTPMYYTGTAWDVISNHKNDEHYSTMLLSMMKDVFSNGINHTEVTDYDFFNNIVVNDAVINRLFARNIISDGFSWNDTDVNSRNGYFLSYNNTDSQGNSVPSARFRDVRLTDAIIDGISKLNGEIESPSLTTINGEDTTGSFTFDTSRNVYKYFSNSEIATALGNFNVVNDGSFGTYDNKSVSKILNLTNINTRDSSSAVSDSKSNITTGTYTYTAKGNCTCTFNGTGSRAVYSMYQYVSYNGNVYPSMSNYSNKSIGNVSVYINGTPISFTKSGSLGSYYSSGDAGQIGIYNPNDHYVSNFSGTVSLTKGDVLKFVFSVDDVAANYYVRCFQYWGANGTLNVNMSAVTFSEVGYSSNGLYFSYGSELVRIGGIDEYSNKTTNLTINGTTITNKYYTWENYVYNQSGEKVNSGAYGSLSNTNAYINSSQVKDYTVVNWNSEELRMFKNGSAYYIKKGEYYTDFSGSFTSVIEGTKIRVASIVPKNSEQYNLGEEDARFATVFCQTVNSQSKRVSKENINPYSDSALMLINNTEIVSYNFKSDKNKTKHVGFIADDTDELMSGVNHDSMQVNDCVGLLLKAIQELTEKLGDALIRIRELEERR